MVGVQVVPQGNMSTAKHSVVCSSQSMCNRISRGLVTNSKMHFQIRNGRIPVGVWPKSLRMGVKKFPLYKLPSFGIHGASQSAGFRNGMRSYINNRDSYCAHQQSNRHSKHSTRAESKSAESRPVESNPWIPAQLEIPKQLRFWEANEERKIDEASASNENPEAAHDRQYSDFEGELMYKEHTVDAETSRGPLSPAAINTIEQFSRLNGMTGRKMRANFEATASVSVQNEARNLVEFCVFRYLMRSGADVHPALWDAEFRRLTFTAMLAWQRPYQEDLRTIDTTNHRRGLVGVEAFVRIASSIPGAADRVTAHSLYRALTRDTDELSFETWDTYIKELCGVFEERKRYQETVAATLGLQPGEIILSVGKNKRQPVQKWSGTMVWPGRLTLTDRALYFEANSFTAHQAPIRLDLTRRDAVVSTKKVGPFGAEVFDSAISVASSSASEPWILEFVDFGNERRRDTWFAIIKELKTAYWFISEYGPKENDPSLNYMEGSKQGRKRTITSSSNSIARLQAVQHMFGRSPDDPRGLLQFYSIKDAPSVELVFESLAVMCWAGRMDSRAKELNAVSNGGEEEAQVMPGQNAMGEDGSLYISRWMVAPTWNSTKSQNFWKAYKGGTSSQGLVLGKNYVVGGLTNLDRAVRAWREQTRVIDKTKATIDKSKLKGIPNNVDLLKELMLPFSIIAVNFQRLKKWEEPGASAGFLIAAMGVVYMNWLRYVFPILLLSMAGILFTLRGLKAQGRLGDGFGKLVIRDQPPTNTIQKIMALKDALTSLEDFLQNTNIALLKLRSVALSRHLHSTNEVLLSLLAAGVVTLFVPFRYLLAGLLVDQFTAELPFRKKSVEEFFNRVNDWWSMIPATPVEVLPSVKSSNETEAHLPEESSDGPNQGEAVLQALSEWLGDSE